MVTFSREEISDIIIAVVVLTVLYAISVTRPMGWSKENLMLFIPISFVAVGLGFILHELGHKFVAQHFGFKSEFRKWNSGLILGIISSLSGYMIFAPGAVYFGSYGRMVTDEENGKISIAGPLVNILLAILFLSITMFMRNFVSMNNNVSYILLLTAYLAFRVNSYLAVFNLIPIPPLDGSKVITWNLPIFLITFVIAALLTYLSYVMPFM